MLTVLVVFVLLLALLLLLLPLQQLPLLVLLHLLPQLPQLLPAPQPLGERVGDARPLARLVRLHDLVVERLALVQFLRGLLQWINL